MRMLHVSIAFAVAVCTLSASRHADACTSGTWVEFGDSSVTGWPSSGILAPSSNLGIGGNWILTAGGALSGTDALWTVGGPYPAQGSNANTLYTAASPYTSWTNKGALDSHTNGEIFEILATGQVSPKMPWFLEGACYGSQCGIYYWDASSSSFASIGNSSGATNFTVDANNVVYSLGLNGSCNTTGYPQGSCIQKTTSAFGSSWVNLTHNPGAAQITSDLTSATPTLYVLGQSGEIWSKAFSSTTWTHISVTSICGGGGTVSPVLIAASTPSSTSYVYAMNDDGGTADYVYRFPIGGTCWTKLGTVAMLAISADLSGDGDLVGIDGSGNLWDYCP
jgi:hypothetical protein